ncbi:MAG: tyrosine-type recombinase/integrase [Bacillota bacterium]
MPKTPPGSLLCGFAAQLATERRLSARTIHGYLDDARLLLQFLAKSQPGGEVGDRLASVTPPTLGAFLEYCRVERGNSHRSLARKLSALRAFFAYLGQVGLVPGNPAQHVPAVEFRRRAPDALSAHEAQLLVAAVRPASNHPERDHALLSVFLHCGCRLSEVVNLRLKDVDLPGRWLTVRGRRNRLRVVPLTPAAARSLRDWLAVRPLVDHDFLFVGRAGRPMSARSMQYVFGKIVAQSPVRRRLSLHNLRHTCLSLLYGAGMDVRSLQEIAGHCDQSSTQVYARVFSEDLQQKMDRHPLNTAMPAP